MQKDRSDIEDTRLLLLATQGDKDAFGQLYERYMAEIYRYIYYRLGDHHEAEDITANVFIKTWEYLPKIYQQGGNIQNFRNWLYRVAKNLIIDFYRTKKTTLLQNGFYEEDDSIKKIVDQNVQIRILIKAIMALKPDYQQIIILRFINQLSHKEVAEIMELSTGQTRILQFRALKKLREIISDDST
jgi:RNA polymerase sigma-70 factor (ECF subfamily)